METGKYYLGLFYFDKGDKRVIVPKMNKMLGWTVNFAQPQAYIIILIIVIVVIFSNRI